MSVNSRSPMGGAISSTSHERGKRLAIFLAAIWCLIDPPLLLLPFMRWD
jgi:hypothetical protein